MAKETKTKLQREAEAAVEADVKCGYVYGKRDLCVWQKRPMHMAKETKTKLQGEAEAAAKIK